MPRRNYEPTIRASELPQTHVLDQRPLGSVLGSGIILMSVARFCGEKIICKLARLTVNTLLDMLIVPLPLNDISGMNNLELERKQVNYK
jgi:hypothetical protein